VSGRRAKRIPKTQLAEYRERALEMYTERMSARQIAKVLGCGRSTVFGWLADAREGGLATDPKKPSGRPPKLSDQQLSRLYAMLFKDPRQFEFEFGLWTRRMVAEVVERKFGVTMSVSAVGAMLRNRLGMSPQRPLHRAAERDPAAVARWETEEFPALAARARAERAQVWFQDESGVRSDYHSGTTWAPIGRTPVVISTGKRFSVNMVSSVNAKGGLHFRLLDGGLNTASFIDYLEALLHDVPGRIFLVLDQHPVHKAKEVARFVESTDGRLTLCFLPGYSPDLNPDEWVWKAVKHDGVGKARALDESQLRAAIVRVVNRLLKCPEIIRGMFSDPHLAYIGSCL
jgi:transposase